MSIAAVLVVLILGGVPVVVVLLAIVLVTRRQAPDPSEAAAAAKRHATAVNTTAWLALVVLGVTTPLILWPLVQAATYSFGSGTAAGLTPALVGLVFLAVHAVGELTWPRPTGIVRRARLSPRDAPKGPRWLRRLTWTWAALLLTALATAGATSPNGRDVSISSSDAVVSAGPYPGWSYGIPLLVAVALILAATEGVLRLIARRPAVVDADPAYDEASRHLSAHRTLRGTQLVLGLTDAVVLLVMGKAVSTVGLTALGGTLTGFGVAVLLVGLVATVLPAQPALPAGPTPVPAGPPRASAEPSQPAPTAAPPT